MEDQIYPIDKYKAAYLQALNDEGARVTSAAKMKLIAAIREVASDVGAPDEGYIYDGAQKAFVPAPAEPELAVVAPVAEGSD